MEYVFSSWPAFNSIFDLFFDVFFFLHYHEAFSNGSQKNKRLGRGVPLAFLFMDQL